MSEIRLQSDIVRKFSELYPNKYGQLFHVSNERNNKMQAFRAAGIGIINGVSDLIYLDKGPVDGFISMVCIEVKKPKSRHKVSQIEQQLGWARIATGLGAKWRLCKTVEEAISCTEGNLKGLTIREVERMLESNGKAKTIQF